GVPTDPEGGRPRLARGDGDRHAEQVIDPFATPCCGRDDGHAQLGRETVRVDRDPVALRLVHEVQADDHAVRDLQDLEDEVQVPLETGRVDDDDHDVRSAEEDEVPGDLLIDR